MPETTTLTACPFCGTSIDSLAFFCPTCGKKVREKPPSTGFWSQLLLYFVSLFLPPFGLGLTLRYLRYPTPTSHRVGFVSLALTLIGLAGAVWLSLKLYSDLNAQVNEAMKKYSSMGF